MLPQTLATVDCFKCYPQSNVCSSKIFFRILRSNIYTKRCTILTIFKCEKKVKVAQSCPILCDPMDWGLLGTSVYGILQARILEWVAIPRCPNLTAPSLFLRVVEPTLHCDIFIREWIIAELNEYIST